MFRGKCIESRLWVYGFFQKSHASNCYIFHPTPPPLSLASDFGRDLHGRNFEVIPKTVGQYIGLQDNNGDDIYAGDICRHRYVPFKEFLDVNTCHVKFETYGMLARFAFRNINGVNREISSSLVESRCVEIIGNETDTPELLEKKK